jgi:hypothetical protein
MKRFARFFAVFALALAGLAASPSTPSVQAAPTIELKLYYLNEAQLSVPRMYTGWNYLGPDAPSLSVWWAQITAGTGGSKTYKLYNGMPGDLPYQTCNEDIITWPGGTNVNAQYSRTRNNCDITPGPVDFKPAHEIVYSPPIKFVPRYWDAGATTPYTISGSSIATYKEGMNPNYSDLSLVCRGTNTWTTTVYPGWELIDAATGTYAIHWSTVQRTVWTSGPGSAYTGCGIGQVTDWREDYYMVAALTVTNGGTAPGVKRVVGGNPMDGHDFDVWYDRWVARPALA